MLPLRKYWQTFLSTPSARRATCQIIRAVDVANISIHALREEGDQRSLSCLIYSKNFYPRPPRGGRHFFRENFSRV